MSLGKFVLGSAICSVIAALPEHVQALRLKFMCGPMRSMYGLAQWNFDDGCLCGSRDNSVQTLVPKAQAETS